MANRRLTDAGIKRFKAAPKGKHFDALTPGLAPRITDKGVKSWALS